MDSNGGYDQNQIKRNKRLNYFKQNCPIFRFAIQTFLLFCFPLSPRGLELGPLAPELSALTMRPPRLPLPHMFIIMFDKTCFATYFLLTNPTGDEAFNLA